MNHRIFAIGAALASLLALGTTAASAYEAVPYRAAPHYGTPHAETPGIDRRQMEQRQRIAHGMRSGQLTQQEAWRLQQQQREIRRMEWRAKADGVVTHQERREIRAAQAHADRSIDRREHNRRHY